MDPWRPVVEVRLRADGGDAILVLAKLDSGATQSYLSLDDARELGIAELIPMPKPISALGSDIRAWTTPSVVEACVHHGASGNDWGEWVTLNPVFGEPSTQLLGLSDFFAAFTVVFDAGADPPAIELALRS